MATILLTGATGFVGRHLLPTLSGQHEVHALARTVPASDSSDVHWIRQDLSQPLDTALLPDNIDAVIHLAQSKHYREFPARADDIFRVNVQSTQQLLEYSRQAGASRFILASSGGVYGSSEDSLVESSPINPTNYYLSSKRAAELLATQYQQLFHIIVFRFFFVYGPGQRDMLIPTLIHKIRQGETITVQGNPGLRMNPIFVEDAVAVFEPALQLDCSRVFNIAGNDVVSLTDLVNLCGQAVGQQPLMSYERSAHVGDLVASNDRMLKELCSQLRTSLRDGLSRAA